MGKILWEERKKKRLAAGKDPRGPGERALQAEMQLKKAQESNEKVKKELEAARAEATTTGSAESVKLASELEATSKRLDGALAVQTQSVKDLLARADENDEVDDIQEAAIKAIQNEVLKYRTLPDMLAALGETVGEVAAKTNEAMVTATNAAASAASAGEAIASQARFTADLAQDFAKDKRARLNSLRRRGLASNGTTMGDLRQGFVIIEGAGRDYTIDLVQAAIARRFSGNDVSIKTDDAASSALAKYGLLSYTGRSLVIDVAIKQVTSDAPLKIDPSLVLWTRYPAVLDNGGATLSLVNSTMATTVPAGVGATLVTTGANANKTYVGAADSSGAAVTAGSAFPSGVVFMVATLPKLTITGWPAQPASQAADYTLAGLQKPDGTFFPADVADASLRVVTVPAGASPITICYKAKGTLTQSFDVGSALRGLMDIFAGKIDPQAVIAAELFGNAGLNWLDSSETRSFVSVLDTLRNRVMGT